MPLWAIVKSIARGAEDYPMHFAQDRQADGDSASGRPQHRGTRDWTSVCKRHQLVVLLPNQCKTYVSKWQGGIGYV